MYSNTFLKYLNYFYDFNQIYTVYQVSKKYNKK